MSFESFRRDIEIEVFDYPLLESYFDLKKPRDKVASLVSEGKIVRVRNGLYVFGENWRKAPLDLRVVANLVYGPSCISFEYALNEYGLMSERPAVVTSLAIGHSKTFFTPIGIFEYRAIDRNKFKVGIEYRDCKEAGYFIASREKALCDFVYRTPGIRAIKQLQYYLFEEMRMDEAIVRELDFGKIVEIAKIYHKNSVQMLSEI